ncbi:hypothetical protein K432DRAFT_171839 [Lepidopterella palustris CBS 459.81]|uniref:Secreted protein n=1 Tax=Lepidopterella palustris CBS 459.81 TaxID=1314670 RepID=A0A8E2EGP8_9PEZI|nr:hypothetical protein K432DRAFT_171839 [Lepidopterella palustris CBS 459.81]
MITAMALGILSILCMNRSYRYLSVTNCVGADQQSGSSSCIDSEEYLSVRKFLASKTAIGTDSGRSDKIEVPKDCQRLFSKSLQTCPCPPCRGLPSYCKSSRRIHSVNPTLSHQQGGPASSKPACCESSATRTTLHHRSAVRICMQCSQLTVYPVV